MIYINNKTKANQNHVHISWDILYFIIKQVQFIFADNLKC